MNDAMYIAATGMQTQQLAVDTIANNMANASTPGFKGGRVNFQELMYRSGTPSASAAAAAGLAAGQEPAATVDQGNGVGVAALVKNFTAGEVSATGNPLDLAIKGSGFVEVQAADGSTAYWRGGTLQVNADGWLATSSGQVIKPQIRVDRNAGSFSISADGHVVSHKDGAQDVEVGQMSLQVFADPEGLRPLGEGLYQPTEASGDATAVHAADAGAGAFAQGAAEQSNVVLVDEMVNLMMAQRAYEMNVRVIQAADEMVGMSNNLRK
jgi:flagellar basal-body rod protein FlgG